MSYKKEIESIKNDNIHGASYLVEKCAKLLLSLDDEKSLIEAAKELRYAQPYMALIYNLCEGVLKNLDNPKEYIQNFLKEEKSQREYAIKRAAQIIKNGDTILTHSFSSMVFEALQLASKTKKFSVFCTESRPKNEGVVLAQELTKLHIDTTLIIDAAAPYVLKDIDAVLIGADGIGDFGLVHKIGTFALALASQRYRIPIYALATKNRFWSKDFILPKETPKDPSDVTSCNVQVKNIYFDIIALDWIKIIYKNNKVHK